jgi:hypothetical protein
MPGLVENAEPRKLPVIRFDNAKPSEGAGWDNARLAFEGYIDRPVGLMDIGHRVRRYARGQGYPFARVCADYRRDATVRQYTADDRRTVLRQLIAEFL